MRVAVAGGNGFIGRHLTRALLEGGHEVTWLSHHPGRVTGLGFSHSEVREVAFDYHDPDGTWSEEVAASDAVVNLSGHPMTERWSPRVLHLVRESRIDTTRALARAVRDAAERGEGPSVFVGASGSGYYGDRGDALLTEASGPGTDALARLTVLWEAETLRAADFGARAVVMRMGVALGEAGFLPKMLPAVRACVGGPLGSGRQWFPWVHVDDVARAFRFALESERVSGPVNVAAPEQVTMLAFARTLGTVVRRPARLHVPVLALRLVVGPAAPYLVHSQRLAVSKLARAGFTWEHPRLEEALRHTLSPASKERFVRQGGTQAIR